MRMTDATYDSIILIEMIVKHVVAQKQKLLENKETYDVGEIRRPPHL